MPSHAPTAVLLLCAAAVAQVEPPADAPAKVARPPELDKIAARILSAWKVRRHHLAPCGVKTLQYDITVESKGGMTGTWKATGRYVFAADPRHPFGVVTWEDEEIERAMTRRGWTAEAFAREIRDDSLLLSLANAKVAGREQKNGTILVVEGGKSPDGQFLLFDKDGRHVGEVVGPMRKRLVYRRYGDKDLLIGESYTMPDTAGELKVDHGKLGDLVVTTAMREVVRVRGDLISDVEMTFGKFVVNGKPAEKAPVPLPPPEEPADKPLGKTPKDPPKQGTRK